MNEAPTSTGGPGRAEAAASIERFLATVEADPDRSPATLANYRRSLARFLDAVPVPPEAIDHDHLTAFRELLDGTVSPRSGEPVLPTTVNANLAALRAYLKWARRMDLLGHPGLRTRRDRRDAKRMRRERTLDPEEDAALMAGCHRVASDSDDPITVRNHALVLFLLATGLRIGEALALRWRDLDLEAGTVHVVRGKGGRERVALMDSRTAGVMARLLRLGQAKPATPVDHVPGIEAWGDDTHRDLSPGDPVFCGSRPLEPMPKSNANSVVRRVSRSFTGTPYTAHCLRHTFCTRFLRHGRSLQDLQTLMELAGHSSMETTQGYLDLDDRIRDERFQRVLEAQWRAAGAHEEAPAAGEAPLPTEASGDEEEAATPATEGTAPPPAGTPTLLDWS